MRGGTESDLAPLPQNEGPGPDEWDIPLVRVGDDAHIVPKVRRLSGKFVLMNLPLPSVGLRGDVGCIDWYDCLQFVRGDGLQFQVQ